MTPAFVRAPLFFLPPLFFVIGALSLFWLGPSLPPPPCLRPALTSNFHLGGHESLLLFSILNALPSVHPVHPPPSPFCLCLSLFSSLHLSLASLSLFAFKEAACSKKKKKKKRASQSFVRLASVCAQPSVLRLLNPGTGLGEKGRLPSCKGPFSPPYLSPPFCAK